MAPTEQAPRPAETVYEKQQSHDLRRWLKALKRSLQLNKREREMGIPDLRWVDGARLPK